MLYEYSEQYVNDGGVANNTILSGLQSIFPSEYGDKNSYARQYISEGGVANDTTLNGNSEQHVNGGTANGTTLYAATAWQYIHDGGIANGTKIHDGNIIVYGGGESHHTEVRGGQFSLLTGSLASGETFVSGYSEMLMEAGLTRQM
ncbi:hypothetical protein CEW81_14000 [Kluyvera genomosp. 3]|uniref:Autotransporter outer membrane beta-barrel domain-containing protein n=1 Tax=Kluyvera genomosp. 3 TaxID=2774055 RepID=A0A248KI94_9ENTR|nr:hypothetical protein CEW81_14000 [Kluyvera genomosp. 3]